MAKPGQPRQSIHPTRAKQPNAGQPSMGQPTVEPPIVVEPQWLLRAGLLVVAAAFVCGYATLCGHQPGLL